MHNNSVKYADCMIYNILQVWSKISDPLKECYRGYQFLLWETCAKELTSLQALVESSLFLEFFILYKYLQWI